VLCAELREATTAGQAAPAMAPCDGPSFLAFAHELETAEGVEYLELRWRARWCADDVRRLYVATDADASPVYAQWLIGPHEQARPPAARHLGGTRRLADDERILEGAYTFPGMRGRGLMRGCMAQLIDRAFDEGAARVWTYVETDNVASLRGCAAVGFSPTSLRRQVHRLGRRRMVELPLDDGAQAAWAAATATVRTQ
jgi:RimJ/RimL family protein N-acetyltransferase